MSQNKTHTMVETKNLEVFKALLFTHAKSVACSRSKVFLAIQAEDSSITLWLLHLEPGASSVDLTRRKRREGSQMVYGRLEARNGPERVHSFLISRN